MRYATPRQAKRDHVVTAKLQKINELDEDNQKNNYYENSYVTPTLPRPCWGLGFGGCVGGVGLLLFA